MLDFIDPTQASSIINVVLIYIVALISPGPDFAMTMRNSLLYSRRTGFFSALGTTLGLAVHLSYAFLGIGLIASQIPWVMALMKYAGALWLVFIGFNSLRSKAKAGTNEQIVKADKDITPFQAMRLGFLTNALNPMVIVLFLSIFSAEINNETSISIMALYASAIAFSSICWFSFVVVCFSNQWVSDMFHKMGHWLDRLTGGMIMAFGLQLAFKAI